MLRVVVFSLFILVSNTGLTIGGYSIGSRNRDYPGSYSSSGFMGLAKDTHSDLSDQLTSGSNYGTNSHQYSTSLSGRAHSSQGSSYASAGNEDSIQSNGFGSHSSNNPDALNSITASSYTNDAYTTDISPGYSSGSSNSDGYSNGHGSSSLVGYSGHSSNLGGLATNEHNSVDYASSSSPYVTTSPSINNYGISGLKASAYTAISKNHGHNQAPTYSLGSTLNLIPNSHPNNYPGSSHLTPYSGSHINSYPASRPGSPSYITSSHSSHKNYPEGSRLASGASLSFLGPHSRDSPNNFIHSQGPLVHRSVPPFLHSAASAVNMNYVKGPNSYYPGAFPKSGSKLIIIKDGSGHSALMHAGEPNFSSGMFGGGAGGYKVRSTGPFSSGSHFGGSNYRSSYITGYPAGSGGHHSSGSPGSYFGYQ
ncbi:probable GH family 25 lysozyme 3 [Chelonus insularis]|uniref:probable GH family 25 lysozyme 3 n=1 Tax=Chelonus insularis TaxID=460826 RepID=UPI00158F2A2E|nr:probable GH family 25 lysozyme 3 [Chelonus insularis]